MGVGDGVKAVAKPAAATVRDAANAMARSSKELAERTQDLAHSAERDAAIAGSETAKGLTDAAKESGAAAAKVGLDAAHIAIAFGQVEKRAATDEVRCALSSAGDMVTDMKDGRIGHAVEDLAQVGMNSLAAVSIPGAQAQQAQRCSSPSIWSTQI